MAETKEQKNQFELVEVPTGKALAFKTPENEVLSTEELLVRIANDLEEVKRALLWLG